MNFANISPDENATHLYFFLLIFSPPKCVFPDHNHSDSFLTHRTPFSILTLRYLHPPKPFLYRPSCSFSGLKFSCNDQSPIHFFLFIGLMGLDRILFPSPFRALKNGAAKNGGKQIGYGAGGGLV